MNLTNEDVQDILRLLDSSSFDVLHLETERFKLTLRRNSHGGWSQETQTLSAPNLVQSSTTASAAATVPAAQGAGPAESGWVDVRAALPGTFYRAPSPGAPPFVEIGTPVASDSVIGIIETMKLMNPVYAGTPGQIVEICCPNAQFAEQGALLMRVQPA
jgi:acetyl-CoA carboxylase biotin carboxyl carrier protein